MVDEVLWVLREIRLGWIQAVMVVADAEVSLTITGNGDVLEPYDGVIGEEISLITVCFASESLCLYHSYNQLGELH